MYLNQYLLKYLFILFVFSNLFSDELSVSQYNQPHKIQDGKEINKLSILSWNIRMLTHPLGWLHNPVERAENIIQALENAELYDAILFQEAFSGSMRNKIYKKLKDIYPNQIEPNDNTHYCKSNSGLWIISRDPVVLIEEISFRHLRGWDKLSSKGAKLYSIIKNQQEFYIINTHMQADYKTKYSDIRIKQYTEIQEKLILPNEGSEIPIILCGDLNISKQSKLKQMLEKLNLMNGPLIGELKYTSLENNHELLDYILVKAKIFKFQSVERRIQNMSVLLTIDPTKLSDHYPIEGIFRW